MQSIREIYKVGRGPSSSHTMGPERAALRFLAEHPEADRFTAVSYTHLDVYKRQGLQKAINAVQYNVETFESAHRPFL